MKKTILIIAAYILFVPQIWAARPLITDDGAITEFKCIELANWLLIDKYSGQLWHSVSIGLHDRVELSVDMYWGYDKSEDDNLAKMSFTAPLLQTKILIRDYEPDGFSGMAVAVGSNLPFGKGAFVPSGYGAFAFAALTQCIGKEENVLIHANLGGTYIRENGKNHSGITWGIGTQVKVYKGFHFVGEFVSGDPYIHDDEHFHGIGFAYQLGICQFISDKLQFDFTFGNGIGGGKNRMPFWISSGINYVLSFK